MLAFGVVVAIDVISDFDSGIDLINKAAVLNEIRGVFSSGNFHAWVLVFGSLLVQNFSSLHLAVTWRGLFCQNLRFIYGYNPVVKKC